MSISILEYKNSGTLATLLSGITYACRWSTLIIPYAFGGCRAYPRSFETSIIRFGASYPILIRVFPKFELGLLRNKAKKGCTFFYFRPPQPTLDWCSRAVTLSNRAGSKSMKAELNSKPACGSIAIKACIAAKQSPDVSIMPF